MLLRGVRQMLLICWPLCCIIHRLSCLCRVRINTAQQTHTDATPLCVPAAVMAGACGIGVFIAFVGMKDSGFIHATPFPTLVGLNVDWPYKTGGC